MTVLDLRTESSSTDWKSKMAASRRICVDCGKSFSKSAYYLHMPCSKTSKNQSTGSGDCLTRQDYIFCSHCNQRVSRRTYNEHRKLRSDIGVAAIAEGSSLAYSEVEDAEYFDVSEEENVCQEEYFDAEDQVFFSESESSSTENTDINDDQDESEEYEYCDDEEEDFTEVHVQGRSPESKALVMFLMLWQSMYKVSDAGIIILLKFLRLFFITLGTLSQVRYLIEFASKLPTTIYMIKAWLGLEEDEFEKCVGCPKCHTLYDLKDCTVQKPNGRVVSRRCSHVRYPRHPHRNRRRECGAVLMKTMRSKSGSLFLYPKRLYCYNRVSESLRGLITKPGFLQKCEEWRRLPREQDCMTDVYHGNVWNGFTDEDGTKYFSKPGNLGLMLNIDWFQPYKHTSYSCGVMYLVVMNLPRHERFKRENIIIAGIIPGPKEPKGNINSYLQPIVDDLGDLWGGIIYEDQALPSGLIKVRAALLALCCDVPASRKCGGFAGHSAKRGCSKCRKEFTTSSFQSKTDFSGYDIENWEPRTNELHRLHANSAWNASCKTQQKQVVRDTGARYSVLYQLPYYNAVRFLVIDPMHCLFLGIAKQCLTLWKQEGLLSDKDFRLLQMRVDAVVPPPEIGRIPSKVATGFSGFSADQWKNWVCYYSLFALKGILPTRHYELWSHYVTACRYLCSKRISPDQCANAEDELILFCKGFQSMYGAEHCTPNMHLSCHLGDCVRDYGPVYGFWCFSFERFNGIMGSYHKNNHNIGLQFMRKFSRDTRLQAMPFPDKCEEMFSVLCAHNEGSVADTLHADSSDTSVQVSPLPPIKRVALDCQESAAMADLYTELYPDKEIHCPRLCDSYSKVLLNGVLCRTTQTVGVIVRSPDGESRAAKVQRFIRHDVVVKSPNGKRRRTTDDVAEVEWLNSHPERHSRYPAPLEVWSTDTACRAYVSTYRD